MADFVVHPEAIAALFGLDVIGMTTIEPGGVLHIPVIDEDGKATGRIVGMIHTQPDGSFQTSWRAESA